MTDAIILGRPILWLSTDAFSHYQQNTAEHCAEVFEKLNLKVEFLPVDNL